MSLEVDAVCRLYTQPWRSMGMHRNIRCIIPAKRVLTTTAFSTKLRPLMLLRSLVERPWLPAAGVTVLAERRRAGRPALDPEGRAGVRGTSDSAAGVVRRRLGDAAADYPRRCWESAYW